MKRIAFICGASLETFIKPIAKALNRSDDYLCSTKYLNFAEGQDKIVKQINKALEWCDVVWFEWANETAILGSMKELCPLIEKRKAIVRLHSYEALSDMPKQIHWQNINKVIFVANHIRQIVDEYNLMNPMSNVIIPNGVDMTRFKIAKTSSNPFHIAYVGNINHKKDPSAMLQIMQKLVHLEKRYKLYIAGLYQDRRYEIYCNHMIKKLGLENNIIFDGFVKNMPKWYNDKAILLHTSIHEGHSYCIMEAMAKGIFPVIHNFMGAEDLYPESFLFNTIDEAVYMITNAGRIPHTDFRDYIIDRKWTFKDQMQQIKETINEI